MSLPRERNPAPFPAYRPATDDGQGLRNCGRCQAVLPPEPSPMAVPNFRLCPACRSALAAKLAQAGVADAAPGSRSGPRRRRVPAPQWRSDANLLRVIDIYQHQPHTARARVELPALVAEAHRRGLSR